MIILNIIISLLLISSIIIIYLLLAKVRRIDANMNAWYRDKHKEDLAALDEELNIIREEKMKKIMTDSATLAAELTRTRKNEIEEIIHNEELLLRKEYDRLKQVLNDNYEQACETNERLIIESNLRVQQIKDIEAQEVIDSDRRIQQKREQEQQLISSIEDKRVEAELNLLNLQESLEQNRTSIEATINQLKKQAAEFQEQYNTNLALAAEKMEAEIATLQATRMAQIDQQLEEKQRTGLAIVEATLVEAGRQAEISKKELADAITLLQLELEDYKKKQSIINEEILRRRELEENTDFYRVTIDPAALSDIQILSSIREKLIFREKIDKLLYENYIDKPAKEMIKRVLRGKDPSGIYKITRLKTGEVYIGKSTAVAARWGQHVKTAFGVGTIAHSMLHTTIQKDGIDNFTFELLEEVPKDKLTEREKYWIEFFDSKSYGLNERNG